MSLFVTGTDTHVGKTLISTLLARRLGWHYWKPIQSGTPSDSAWVSQFLPTGHVHPEVYRLQAPLSPHQSAEREGLRIHIHEILRRKPHADTIIEGAGGVLVPVNEREFIVDLIKALGHPAVVVTRGTLGTLNHTLLTLEALRSRNIDVLGVIVNGETLPGYPESLEHFGKTAILAQIPLAPQLSEDIIGRLAEELPSLL